MIVAARDCAVGSCRSVGIGEIVQSKIVWSDVNRSSRLGTHEIAKRLVKVVAGQVRQGQASLIAGAKKNMKMT